MALIKINRLWLLWPLCLCSTLVFAERVKNIPNSSRWNWRRCGRWCCRRGSGQVGGGGWGFAGGLGGGSGFGGAQLATGAPRKFSIVLEYRDVPAWVRLWRPLAGRVLRFPRERSRVCIRAESDAGLLNGVYALCHEVLGARWYWAGDLGKAYVGEVPRFFPERFGSRSPAFVQRRMYPVGNDYGRRNRLIGGYSFNHNLAKVFTPEVYASDPEIFPVVRG